MMHINLHKETDDIESCIPREAIEYTWTNVDDEPCTAYSPPNVDEGIVVTQRELNSTETNVLMEILKVEKESTHGVSFIGSCE